MARGRKKAKEKERESASIKRGNPKPSYDSIMPIGTT
jgi:hypothetical protein